jgi:hypothetical protein
MKEEIIKIKFEEYNTVKYKNSSPIGYKTPVHNISVWDDTVIFEEGPKKDITQPVFLVDEVYSKNEEVFVENYGNPLCQIKKDYIMAVVEKDGDKVSLKMFTGTKMRTKGVSYFRVKKNVDYITVNNKTGDVYTGYLHNFQKKRKAGKKIRRNFFMDEPLALMKNKLRNNFNLFETPIEQPITSVINDIINKFIDSIDQCRYSNLSNDDRLFKFYLDKRGVKYPNNFGAYKQQLIGPTIRKKLKKNGGKLVDAFMEEKQLSGSVLKKSLHECSRINLDVYLYAKKVFGIDRLNQDKGTIVKLLESIMHVNSPQYDEQLMGFFSPVELDRYYGAFKEVFIYGNIDTYTLSDHVRMYCQLREYGVDVKWTVDGRDKDEFHREHLDWTDKLSHYRNGDYNRIYPKVLHEILSKKIGECTPVLLTTSKEYNEESATQSNCVKGYVSRPESIIISLRNDNGNRATIEYRIKLVNGETSISRVQSLGKHNKSLEDIWNNVLLSLDQRMLSYVKDKNFDFVKIIKENRMGMRFESNSIWGPYNSLVWENSNVNNNNGFSLFD